MRERERRGRGWGGRVTAVKVEGNTNRMAYMHGVCDVHKGTGAARQTRLLQ